jgi:hypothetical protein
MVRGVIRFVIDGLPIRLAAREGAPLGVGYDVLKDRLRLVRQHLAAHVTGPQWR